MDNQKRPLPLAHQLEALRPTDRAVLAYLNQLRKEDDTCTASLPSIAAACDISERQAQVSTGRLIRAGLLERIGYDFGNAVRLRRGTKYRLLKTYAEIHYEIEAVETEGFVHQLLKRQSAIESHLERLASKQDKLLSLVTLIAKHNGHGNLPKRSSKEVDPNPESVNTCGL